MTDTDKLERPEESLEGKPALDSNPAHESDLDLPMRIRRRRQRRLIRLFAWEIVTSVVLIWAGDLAYSRRFSILFMLSGFFIFIVGASITVVLGYIGNSYLFRYKAWEQIGFLFANIVFVICFVIFLGWLSSRYV